MFESRSAAAAAVPHHKQLPSFLNDTVLTNTHFNAELLQCGEYQSCSMAKEKGRGKKSNLKRDKIAAKRAPAHARTRSYRNLAAILQWRCGRWQEDKVLMRSLHYLAVGPFCFLCLTAEGRSSP